LAVIAALVTEDVQYWRGGHVPLHGRAELCAAFEALFDSFHVRQEFKCEDLMITGNSAFMRGREINHLEDKAGGAKCALEQRVYSILKRDPDGNWKFSWRGSSRSAFP
jgi:ketosteroid isomerase-like protein